MQDINLITIPVYQDKNNFYNGFDNKIWKEHIPDDNYDPLFFDDEIKKVVDDNYTDKFFYPVFLTHWLYPYKDTNKELWKNFKIPETVLQKIRQGKCKILIHNSMEGWTLSTIDELIYITILQKYNLNLSSIVYMTGNMIKYSPAGVRNVYFNRFENLYHYYNKKRIDLQKLSIKPLIKNVELTNKFLCLNRRPSPQRLALYNFIYDYRTEGLISQATDINNNNDINHALNGLKQYFPEIYNEFKSKQLEKTLPAVIDYSDMFKNNPTHDFKIRKYINSYLHIVSETYFNDKQDRMFFSEKIIKPIVFMRPFVLFGPHNSLNYFRSLGYKTFGGFIDESYDDIRDYTKRFHAACNSIKKFIDRDKSVIHKDLIKMIPILNHNYTVLAGRTRDQNDLAKQLINILNR
jgi:hypothetical protein